jgi:hypothetical protein
MELRNHPKMTWEGCRTWPPTWNGPHGPDNPLPVGEVGALLRVEIANLELKPPHCDLVMHYNNQDYFGTLFFDDEKFLQKLCGILNAHTGEPISAIGSLDVP